MTWPRPIPVLGDASSASQRAVEPTGWRFASDVRDAVYTVVGARRDVRRFRPDPVPVEVVESVLGAAHAAPSVGHSQPWRFIVVDDPELREQAALMADRERLSQAARLDQEAGRSLLDLQLEGIREAPLGVVVCCDRRTSAGGVLGRATFPDTDVWSCACAIENLWLTARAEGLGMGWVTLFQPAELAELLGLPDGVVTLGWLCLGWPDERPPAPGLERAGWSRRAPLSSVVMPNRWPDDAPPAPVSRLRAPDPAAVVAARDATDVILTTPSSLGVLDRAADKVVSLGHGESIGGTLLLAVGRHLVADLGVSAYEPAVTDDLLDAARAGRAMGAVAAQNAGLTVEVVDAGSATGNLRDDDPMTLAAASQLVRDGEALGIRAAAHGWVALGEIGIGNTTVASALAASLLQCSAEQVVGLGAGADNDIVAHKIDVVASALARWADLPAADRRDTDPAFRLAALGGPEFALLTGAVLGAAAGGAVIVLDGLATSVAALLAVRHEPAVAAHLVAGQRSRERAHGGILQQLGLEPLLDVRMRAGEGVGACLATQLLQSCLRLRLMTARTS